MRRRHLPYLDGWRGLAILGVLAGHFLIVPGVNTAAFGVELFFVLSGRLMAEILFVEREPLPAFFKRRVSRIVPALLLFVISGVAAGVVLQHWKPEVKPLWNWLDAVAVATFTTNYLQAWTGQASIFGHAWSLAVEEHCYILMALTAALTGRSERPGYLVLALLTAACMLDGALRAGLALNVDHAVYWLTDARAGSVLLSAAMFLWMQRKDVKAPVWLSPLCFVLALLLSYDAFPSIVRYTAVTALLAVSVNCIGAAISPIRLALEAPALIGAGLLSYSIYLWQQPFMEVGLHFHLELVARAGLMFVALAIAVASYLIVEKPARRWLNVHWT